MVEVDFLKHTYTCPFCGREQVYWSSYSSEDVGYYSTWSKDNVPTVARDAEFKFYCFKCNNNACEKVTVIGKSRFTDAVISIVPQYVHKHYPDYIPQQIRNDYEEANMILDKSPKAAATLLRRCLQGMLHDFWNIHEKNLNAEITTLKNKVPTSQWNAIDGLRKIGNIGAHMEQDVNRIIEVDASEAQKLNWLIELLIEKWYISRHDEEALYAEICTVSEEKQNQRKKGEV